AELPQSPRGNGIGCTRAYSVHFRAVVIRKRAGDLAVGAIDAAHAVKLRTCRTPPAGGRALLRRLLVVSRIDDGLAVLVDDLTRVDLSLRHVPDQIRHNPSRMHGKSADASMMTDRAQRA